MIQFIVNKTFSRSSKSGYFPQNVLHIWTAPLLLVRTTLSCAAKTNIPQNLSALTNKTLFLQQSPWIQCLSRAVSNWWLKDPICLCFVDQPSQKAPSRVKFHWGKERWKATQGLLINSAQKWHSLLLLTAHWLYYQTNCKEGWKINTFYVIQEEEKWNTIYFCQTLCSYHGGKLLRTIFWFS